MILGAARPTVSVVAGVLQKSGLVTYHRGRVRILDRPGLEKAACECYAASASFSATSFRPDRSGAPPRRRMAQPLRSRGVEGAMIRKLSSGQYRLYSRKVDAATGRRRNLGTFATRAAALKHERAVQFFKRQG